MLDQVPESKQPPQVPTRIELDPVWGKNAERIRSLRASIGHVNTLEGEKICKEVLNQPIFSVYHRLPEVFESLVSLVEYDEICKEKNTPFFSNGENQRMILRALGLIVEDAVKFPYETKPGKKYQDHKPIFEGLIKRFHALDANISNNNIIYPNFVGTLIITFQQEVNKIKGLEDFSIKTDRIRKRIKEYLPKLSSKDGQDLSDVILSKLVSSQANV